MRHWSHRHASAAGRAAAVLYGAACYTPWQVGVTCDEAGFWQLAQLFIAALVANQATYLIGVKPSRTATERTE
jgi:cyanate permease